MLTDVLSYALNVLGNAHLVQELLVAYARRIPKRRIHILFLFSPCRKVRRPLQKVIAAAVRHQLLPKVLRQFKSIMRSRLARVLQHRTYVLKLIFGKVVS